MLELLEEVGGDLPEYYIGTRFGKKLLLSHKNWSSAYLGKSDCYSEAGFVYHHIHS